MRIAWLAPLPLMFGLSGCGSLLTEGTADLAGVAGAGAASAVTRSAAGAAAIGLGVRSVAAEGVKYVTRSVHREEQDAIAAAAGPAEAGTVRAWSVSHRIPVEDDARGQVVVSRAFSAGGGALQGDRVFHRNHPAPGGAAGVLCDDHLQRRRAVALGGC